MANSNPPESLKELLKRIEDTAQKLRQLGEKISEFLTKVKAQ